MTIGCNWLVPIVLYDITCDTLGQGLQLSDLSDLSPKRETKVSLHEWVERSRSHAVSDGKYADMKQVFVGWLCEMFS